MITNYSPHLAHPIIPRTHHLHAHPILKNLKNLNVRSE